MSDNGVRVVWATRFAPSPLFRGGDALYSAGLIGAIARRARVDVLCFGQDGVPPPTDSGRLRWHVLPRPAHPQWRSVLHHLPNIAYQFATPGYARALRLLASGADAVFLDHIATAWCAGLPGLPGTSGRDPVTVFVTHNHEAALRAGMPARVSSPLLRAALRLDALKAMRLEARALRRVDAATAVTDADAAAFRAENPDLPVLCVPPGYDGRVVPARRIDASVPLRAVLLGGTAAFHKRLVLQESLRALSHLDTEAGATVDVIGEIDPDVAASFGALPAAVRLRGYVENLGDDLVAARAALVTDVVGGGFKLRALTFAFHRVPMLAVAGALSGMGLTAGRDYLEFPDLPSLVRTLPDTLRDTKRLNTVQEAAFETCRRKNDWQDRAADLLALVRELRQRRAGSHRLLVGRRACGIPNPYGDSP